MRISFEKYHGTGNDFIVIDDTEMNFPANDHELIRRLCDRNFGIGSDGLMLVSPSDRADFEMIFFNPDASKSLCGNGSRCSVQFARKLGLASGSGVLNTTDGLHDYKINEDETISIKMNDVDSYEKVLGHWFINTGSPHLMVGPTDLDALDVKSRGSELRFRKEFAKGNGTNVNFFEEVGEYRFKLRTYERGVENETLSCGTGVTAAALAMALDKRSEGLAYFNTKGGKLKVDFDFNGEKFENIWLTGPVKHVYSGEIDA